MLLLHGQSSAWQSYSGALPDLSTQFHVFAIDFPGHGGSDHQPDLYTVDALGALVLDFIEQVIGEPVILSGHSSGGLIAALLAAVSPTLIRSVLLEDPPFFSTNPDRAPATFNYVDLATPAHNFLNQSVETDFTSFYIENNAWIGYFGGADGVVSYAQKFRSNHPAQPLLLWFMPPSLNESVAHMHRFDTAFADTFYRFTWQSGFDQADTLRRITQPTILVHANWRLNDKGILEGAMTDDDARLAHGLVGDCRFERVNTG